MPIFQVSNFLSRLPAEMSSTLFAGATRSRLAADEVLFYAGDFGDGCYRVEQGLVKVVVSSPNGDERSIAILGPGSIVGELSVLDGLPRSASVIALRDCSLQFISRDLFDRCTRQHPEIYKYLTAMLALRLREADEVLAATSFMTVKGRLARAFLELAEHLGQKDDTGHVTLGHKISQRELASIAGIARENVSRTLATWKRRKIVAMSAGFYRILNIKAVKDEMDGI
jgi:CRP/FNR family transcriptional regulator, cyclic AMP receptor protein